MSPHPCLYDIVMQSYIQCKIPMQITTVGKTCAVSWAVPHHSMSMGQLWGALAPQGYNLYPTAGYVLAQLDSLLKCGDSHVSTKFYDSSKLAVMLSLWDFLADFSPDVQTSYARSLIKVIAHLSSIGRMI